MSQNAEIASLDTPITVDRSQFLSSMRVVPGAVAIIAATDGEDQTGMAVTAWNSLCADPPMLLVCVNRSASAHDLIRRAKAFSLNVAPAASEETVAIFSAQRGLNGRDRFLDGHWSKGPQGQPLLDGAVTAYECEVIAHHIYGTHSIFIGEIRHMIRNEAAEALIYLNGRFARAEGMPQA
jgi:flavin reductase (DIM6/NTAB) family NADH-FMN oxidoreductase RutF